MGSESENMSNLPESLFDDEPSVSLQALAALNVGEAGPSSSRATRPENVDLRGFSVSQLILALNDENHRDNALQLLSEKKEIRGELGPMLWNSFGTIAILLKEITAVYRILSSPNIPDQVLNRVCNALAILQSVAVHPDTRKHFIKANMPQYLYPFLSTLNKEKPQEYLRISSLGVIGSLAKSEDVEVIHFLIETQVFPHCLRCMEIGSAISKAVATLIVQKILMSDDGMKYCCTLADRFFVICCSLRQMVDTISEEPSSKQLLKYIVRCYLRLSENPRALDGLICCLPPKLTDASIINLLRDDRTAMGWLNQLLYNISTLHPKHRNLSSFARP